MTRRTTSGGNDYSTCSSFESIICGKSKLLKFSISLISLAHRKYHPTVWKASRQRLLFAAVTNQPTLHVHISASNRSRRQWRGHERNRKPQIQKQGIQKLYSSPAEKWFDIMIHYSPMARLRRTPTCPSSGSASVPAATSAAVAACVATGNGTATGATASRRCKSRASGSCSGRRS